MQCDEMVRRRKGKNNNELSSPDLRRQKQIEIGVQQDNIFTQV